MYRLWWERVEGSYTSCAMASLIMPPTDKAEICASGLAHSSASVRLWWISFLAFFVRGVCLARRSRRGSPKRAKRILGLASDATCIKTSTRPAVTPFTQCNWTLIFVDGFDTWAMIDILWYKTANFIKNLDILLIIWYNNFATQI